MKNTNIGNSHIMYGDTVSVDHTVTTFVVTVRASSISVGCDTIKDLIESRHEVVSIQQIDKTNMVVKL
jgi:hypothetical protein